MKLLLLHGPAINSSRTKLLQIKKKFDPENVIVFERGADPKDILDTLVATPLFNENKLVLIENPSDDFLIPSTLNHLPYTIVLWFDHEIDPKKWLASRSHAKGGRSGPPGEVFFFPEAKEVSVFPFLDNLGNKDKKAFLELDKLKRAGYDNQHIIIMIFYLLRNVVATPKMAKDFVKRKNAKMRANFSQEELINIYKDILEIDFKIKSGLLEKSQAEFMLVNRFVSV